MTRIVCPKCEASIEGERPFQAHMEEEHPGHRASVGFGHTLEQ